MKDIGLRELKARVSEILRHVEESHEVYAVTRRGRPVGVLAPIGFESKPRAGKAEGAWERLESLADRLSESRGGRKSAVRALSRMRR